MDANVWIERISSVGIDFKSISDLMYFTQGVIDMAYQRPSLDPIALCIDDSGNFFLTYNNKESRGKLKRVILLSQDDMEHGFTCKKFDKLAHRISVAVSGVSHVDKQINLFDIKDGVEVNRGKAN